MAKTSTPSAAQPVSRRVSTARTRARVLAAAATVISEVGPDAASVQRITAEAGVSQGVVGWQFGSKNALVIEVVHTALNEIADALALAIADGGTRPFTALVAAFEPLVETVPGRVLVTSLSHVIADEDALRSTYASGLGLLMSVTDEAVRTVDNTLSAAQVRSRSAAFVSALLGYASQRVLDPGLPPETLRAAGRIFDGGAP